MHEIELGAKMTRDGETVTQRSVGGFRQISPDKNCLQADILSRREF